jgi:carbonic anhydrase/acetyltransferase-like protein (isoleucine patch superfamily)
MIAGGAVVTPGADIPDGMLAAGVPAKVRGPIAGTPSEVWVMMNPPAYRDLAARHLRGMRPLDA